MVVVVVVVVVVMVAAAAVVVTVVVVVVVVAAVVVVVVVAVVVVVEVVVVVVAAVVVVVAVVVVMVVVVVPPLARREPKAPTLATTRCAAPCSRTQSLDCVLQRLELASSPSLATRGCRCCFAGYSLALSRLAATHQPGSTSSTMSAIPTDSFPPLSAASSKLCVGLRVVCVVRVCGCVCLCLYLCVCRGPPWNVTAERSCWWPSQVLVQWVWGR